MMLPEIEAQFHEGVLHDALEAFSLNRELVHDLGGFESRVYEVQTTQGQQLIMKITHTLRRSPEVLMGELDFVHHLSQHGVPVSCPVRATDGAWVVVLPQANGSSFLALAYEKVPGRATKAADLQPLLVSKLGHVMGRMHALSRTYTSPEPDWKRQEWHDDPLFDPCWIPAEQQQVLEQSQTWMAKLRQRPRSRATYGLVHSDLHQGNFFITAANPGDPDPGQLWVFDFDDCEYHWFVND
ncbi:MAG: phosphotransferase, partial [Myxococcota bacterium]